jgi:carboxyl-terminal processing protease
VETVEVIRDQMESSPVTVEDFPSELRIGCQRNLTDQMVADVSKALHALGAKKKIVTIDLRGCGGGKVETAVSFASLFLPANDLIAKLETVDGREKLMSSNPAPFYPSKMVILQDRFTASAAEMIIAALVSNRRFPVETRGQRSYGKGVTQRPVEIVGDEKGTTAGVLKITDTRIYGPKDEVWDGEGLPPMVEAK